MSNKEFRVVVPTNLDAIFSIDNFKFSEVKTHIKTLFEVLQKMGIRMEDLDFRFVSKISQINEMAKTVKLLQEKGEEAELRIETLRSEMKDIEKNL